MDKALSPLLASQPSTETTGSLLQRSVCNSDGHTGEVGCGMVVTFPRGGGGGRAPSLKQDYHKLIQPEETYKLQITSLAFPSPPTAEMKPGWLTALIWVLEMSRKCDLGYRAQENRATADVSVFFSASFTQMIEAASTPPAHDFLFPFIGLRCPRPGGEERVQLHYSSLWTESIFTHTHHKAGS